MRWLIDEMLPPQSAAELSRRGHDAVSVAGLDLNGEPDAVIFDTATGQARVIVTENVADVAVILDRRLRNNEPAVPVIFIRKDALSRRGARAGALAERLHRWAGANREPCLGAHWL